MSNQTDLLREAVRLLGISIDDYDNITEGEFSGTSYYEPRMRFSQEARAFLAKIDAAEGELPEGFTLVENRALSTARMALAHATTTHGELYRDAYESLLPASSRQESE